MDLSLHILHGFGVFEPHLLLRLLRQRLEMVEEIFPRRECFEVFPRREHLPSRRRRRQPCEKSRQASCKLTSLNLS